MRSDAVQLMIRVQVSLAACLILNRLSDCSSQPLMLLQLPDAHSTVAAALLSRRLPVAGAAVSDAHRATDAASAAAVAELQATPV
jgi:hypothetical protein